VTGTGDGSPTPATTRVRPWLATGHRIVEVAELTAGCLLVATLMCLVVLQAAQRYLPVSGWVWTGELARYSLVWLTFALAGYLTGRGEQIGLEVIDHLARGRLLHFVRRFADAVVALAAVAFTMDAWQLLTESVGRTSPAIRIPLHWVYLMPLLGFALTALRAGWAAAAGRPDPDPEAATGPGTGTHPETGPAAEPGSPG
jgi:TRAP-type C4-dicarboxylate transport system permease small subunit